MAVGELQCAASRERLPTVDRGTIDRFLGESDRTGFVTVLMFSGDPVRWPEASDVAVVLPELIEAFQNRLRGAVVSREAEGDLAKRFGVNVYPSLALWRAGTLLGVISKIRDWAVYIERISGMLDGAGGQPRDDAEAVRSEAAVVKSIIPPHVARKGMP
jgi:hydrogenase-1 operon protein HyaE